MCASAVHFCDVLQLVKYIYFLNNFLIFQFYPLKVLTLRFTKHYRESYLIMFSLNLSILLGFELTQGHVSVA